MNTPSRAADAGLCGCPVPAAWFATASRIRRCALPLRTALPKARELIAHLGAVDGGPDSLRARQHPAGDVHAVDHSGSAGREDTIFSASSIWQSGSWDIAAIIFIASILIPSTKFIVLAVLLVNARRRRVRRPALQAQLYRALEAVGYWSMLDVLVVGLVTAVVKFRGVSEAEPRIGILFFGMVVVLTMLGTLAFDPRLLWDSPSRHPPHG